MLQYFSNANDPISSSCTFKKKDRSKRTVFYRNIKYAYNLHPRIGCDTCVCYVGRGVITLVGFIRLMDKCPVYSLAKPFRNLAFPWLSTSESCPTTFGIKWCVQMDWLILLIYETKKWCYLLTVVIRFKEKIMPLLLWNLFGAPVFEALAFYSEIV